MWECKARRAGAGLRVVTESEPRPTAELVEAGRQASAEFSWLRHWQGDLALLVDRDPSRARRLAAEAATRPG